MTAEIRLATEKKFAYLIKVEALLKSCSVDSIRYMLNDAWIN